MVQNKGVIFKQPPSGWPVPGQDLAVESRDFDTEQEPPQGGITVKNYYASFDPYQRGRMRPADVKSYAAPFELGKPITNRVISKVLKSSTDKFSSGDIVISSDVSPIEEYSALGKDWVEKARKLENPYNLDPKIFLGALGMPGLTAWSSFYDIGQPKKGETIFVTAASGAVGQLVGQLAKHEGLKVIGSVGSDEKLEFITKELGFDAGFNYKKEKPADALARLAPDGIDIYYENVGGEQLEAAINSMNPFGRIGTYFFLLSTHLHPLTLPSRLRHGLTIQPQTRRIVPHPQLDASCGQANHDARLHRWRRQHGPTVRKRPPGEAAKVDCRRHVQSANERDGRYR
jgi:NADPH-dependent curcumin reductase CurA